MMPVYMHVFDGKEFLMSHPIPDDDSSYRGDDIAIWTDDPAIADAMSEMSERISQMGKPAADLLAADRGTKRVAVTRPRTSRAASAATGPSSPRPSGPRSAGRSSASSR